LNSMCSVQVCIYI